MNAFPTFHDEKVNGYKYSFSVFTPNHINLDSMDIDDVLFGEGEDGTTYTQITEKEAKKHCGFN